MLVGEGAKLWARSQNIEEVPDEFLKTGKILLTN
jgi:hypothetical protein